MALELGLGVTPWSPLRGGVLSGKYTRANAGSVKADRGERVTSFLNERTYAIIDELIRIGRELAASPASVALAWVQSRPGVASTIIGARRIDQLEQNLAALDVTLSLAHLAALNAVSEPSLNFPGGMLRFVTMFTHGGMTVNGVTAPDWPLAPKADARALLGVGLGSLGPGVLGPGSGAWVRWCDLGVPRTPKPHHRIEDDAERAERLAAPLRAEPEQDDVALAVRHVERRRAVVQELLAEQIAGEERRAGRLVPGQHLALEPLAGLECGADSTKIAARSGMPAITGCVVVVSTSRTEPPVKNSWRFRPSTTFLTGSANCWMANAVARLKQTSVPPPRTNASIARTPSSPMPPSNCARHDARWRSRRAARAPRRR